MPEEEAKAPECAQPEGKRRRLRKILPFAAFCALLAALLATLAFISPEAKISPYPKCPLHEMTGLHCAGCGSTRALHSLLRGDIRQALAWNPLFVAALPFGAWLLARWGAKALFGFSLPLPRITTKRVILLCAFLICFMILRNIPAKPFKSLAPHPLKKTEQIQNGEMKCDLSPSKKPAS